MFSRDSIFSKQLNFDYAATDVSLELSRTSILLNTFKINKLK